MLYVLSPSQGKENWLWLYLINEIITWVSAPKLCKNWKLSSVGQCGDVSRPFCTEHEWEVVWVGCTDSKTHNPSPSPPPDAVWWSALYLCGCTSLSITHESIPDSEWEELKHSLHLRHCDVSEAFMQMFKREHPIGLRSMILALLTVLHVKVLTEDWHTACRIGQLSYLPSHWHHVNILRRVNKWQVDNNLTLFHPSDQRNRNHKRKTYQTQAWRWMGKITEVLNDG